MKRESPVPFYRTEGTVIHGRGIGKLVGMPTANLKLPEKSPLPETGVYIAKVRLDGAWHYGVAHIGTRPTVDSGGSVYVEVHILNFNREIYGRCVEIRLFSRIRDSRQFEDLTSLLEQIRDDCAAARSFWGLRFAASGLSVDRKTHQVHVAGKGVFLSAKEFDVLYLLFSNPDAAFTKGQIYEAVWHQPANDSYHAVENTVFQIRKKLRACAPEQDYIKTIVGFGYQYGGDPRR